MRIRRNVPQKPLTEEQKARAIEAQKQSVSRQIPLTNNQLYQSQVSPISSTAWRYPYNTMDRSFMMTKKMSFEEKYGVYNNQQEDLTTKVEAVETPVLDPDEDMTVPPSLEEDPNQSPLPPGVQNFSDVDNLDDYINQQEPTNNIVSDPKILRDMYEQMEIKELKEEYVSRGWTRDISHNNNKKNLINLIIDLIVNEPQQEETDWATAW